MARRAKQKKPANPLDTKPKATLIDAARNWLRERNIEDIECILPDQAGVARGKVMPVAEIPRRSGHDHARFGTDPNDCRRVPAE